VYQQLARRYDQFISNHPEFRVPRRNNDKSAKPQHSPPPTIKINNLTLSYNNSKKLIFDKASLDIQAGEHIGIIGGSGTGKTTFIQTLSGLIETTPGMIQIDDMPPREYYLYHRCSYVGSHPYLFNGTLRENLVYGQDQEIKTDKLMKLLNKFDLTTKISEKELDKKILIENSGLSTGEQQRLSIIRTLLGSPSFILLDEATSNLDFKNQNILCELLAQKKKECTVIFISHRLEALKEMDHIYELIEGKFKRQEKIADKYGQI
jgi:ABC-type transport system involved in cytochrome bd biosynthesis fused ATPase/permease subunit